jgi:DHA2 family multidrug resistance protein-like MFS transporter
MVVQERSARGAAGPREGGRAWAGLAVLAMACLLVSMDAHVLNLAIPALTRDLRPTASQLLWVVDGYGFFVAASLIPLGALGDRVGRRRLLLLGGAAFGVLSLLAAFSTGPVMLLVVRALLGVAGATLMPSTLSLIRVLFPDPSRRRTAFGVWTASFALGGVVAPLIAGALLERFWWGSVFLVAIPPTVLLLALGPLLLPESRTAGESSTDAVGAVLLLAAVLGLVYGVKRAAQDGVDVWAAATILAGLVVAGAFLRRQAGRRHPLIDLSLFSRRAFSVPLAVNAAGFFVLYGTSLFVAQYVQLVLGLSPLAAGLTTVPPSLGYLAGSVAGPIAARRVGPVAVTTVGLVLAAAGFGLLTSAGSGGGLPAVVTGSVVFSVGLAPVYLLAAELTVASVPSARAGAAAGLLETSAELGGALGIALLGSLGSVVFRLARTDGAPDLPGGGAPTLGSALSAAAGPTAEAAAREAFVTAFRVVEAVGSFLLAAAALATVLLLGARTSVPDAATARRRDLDDREDGLTRAPDGASDRERPGIS